MKFDRVNVLDGAHVDDAVSNVPRCNESAQPLGGIGLDLVVVGGHGQSARPPSDSSATSVTMGNSEATARGPRQRWAYSQARQAGTRSVR